MGSDPGSDPKSFRLGVVGGFFRLGCELWGKAGEKGLTENRQDVVVDGWEYTAF